uniref:Putative secreted salivary protein salp15ir-3 n=1 Tax=Ixodes ricinus TaxID=34613 RepID=V5H523_IXORI
MKVACIILLFVIAAGGTVSQRELPLKFPKFISKPQEFALKLLKICNEHSTKELKSMRHGHQTEPRTTINDTCADKDKCVGGRTRVLACPRLFYNTCSLLKSQ